MKARIMDEKRELIEPLLNQGVNLGASVSGSTIRNPYNPNDIGDWNLLEISLLAIPADQSTMGKVEIAKNFKEIINMEEKRMAEETQEFTTKDEVIELINTGINERQEETLEKIRDELKTEYETAITELTKRVETIESQLKDKKPEDKPEDEKKPEDKPEDEKKPEEVNKEFNAEEVVEKTLQKIFGASATNGLNIKYSDKGFKFESPSVSESENKDSKGSEEIVDKKMNISEIAKII